MNKINYMYFPLYEFLILKKPGRLNYILKFLNKNQQYYK